jgi:hypothetical protein
MREAHEDIDWTPERVERLMRAARVARSRDVRAAVIGAFRRLRRLVGTKPERHRATPSPAPC